MKINKNLILEYFDARGHEHQGIKIKKTFVTNDNNILNNKQKNNSSINPIPAIAGLGAVGLAISSAMD